LSGYTNFPQENRGCLVAELARDRGLIDMDENRQIGIALHRIKSGYALHILNYNFNEKTHRIDPVWNIRGKIKFSSRSIKTFCFPEESDTVCTLNGDVLEVKNAGIYTVIEFL
jgi:hypothetical protein